MKTKKTEINCNTMEDVTHTTHKCFHTLKKYRLLTFPLRETCQPCVLEAKKRLKRCDFYRESCYVRVSKGCMGGHWHALSCHIMSCLVLSCLALSCLVLSCLVLSCLVLSCLVLSGLVYCLFSCLVWSCLVGACLVLCYCLLSCLALSCLALFCLA